MVIAFTQASLFERKLTTTMNDTGNNMSNKDNAIKYGPNSLTTLLGELFDLLQNPYRDRFHTVDISVLIENWATGNLIDLDDIEPNEEAEWQQLHQNEDLQKGLIICNPLNVLQEDTADATHDFICNAIIKDLKYLSADGRAGIIVPLSLLGADSRLSVVIKNDELVAVVQLPDKILASVLESPACLLMIDRKRDKLFSDQVLFIKPAYVKAEDIDPTEQERILVYCREMKSNWEETAVIGTEELRTKGYQLSPVAYISKLKTEIERLKSKGTCKRLGEVCTVLMGKHPAKGAYEHKVVVDSVGPDIDAKDYTYPYKNYQGILRRSLLQKYIPAGVLDFTEVDDEKDIVSEKCIVAHIGASGVAAQIFDPVESFKDWTYEVHGKVDCQYKGLHIGKDVFAIVPDADKLDSDYLYYQLYSPLVTMQVEAIVNHGDRKEAGLTKAEWESIIIPVPSIDEQRIYVIDKTCEIIELKERRDKEASERLAKDLKVDINEVKQESEKQIVQFITHNIAPKIAMIAGPIDRTLRGLVNRCVKSHQAAIRSNTFFS